MASKLITTHELTGTRVLGGKNGKRRIGKIRRFVFHPKEKRCVGFIVKRPDLLWMFRRKDRFVSLDGYDLVDGRVVIRNIPEATDRAACRALGVDWDSCVLWIGMPVMTEDGESLGAVGSVTFDRIVGTVDSVEVDLGATANALLGKRIIPSSLITGFRRGKGVALSQTGSASAEEEEVLGAIMVSNEARDIPVEGGVAEQAGKATAVAVDKAHTVVDKAKPIVSEAAQKTGEAVNKGAYVTGKQISRSKTMFSDFKEEYSKARGPKPKPEEKAIDKAPATSETPTRKKQSASKQPASKKNMFSAFKEEYDKARHDEE